MRGLFVTGTDTGVGKTFVACGILRQLRVAGPSCGAYKPVCSGAVRRSEGDWEWEDVERLFAACGAAFPRERICPQRFVAPLAPPAAAHAEGLCVDAALLQSGLDWWRGRVDLLLVEGAGGLLSPVAEDLTNADLALQFGFPLLIVAANRLGVINHTLLTIEVAQKRGLEIAGVLLNRTNRETDESSAGNWEQLNRWCPVPLLGEWSFGGADALRPGGDRARIDWQALAGA